MKSCQKNATNFIVLIKSWLFFKNHVLKWTSVKKWTKCVKYFYTPFDMNLGKINFENNLSERKQALATSI